MSFRFKFLTCILFIGSQASIAHGAPISFAEAKKEMVHIYADKPESFYCACNIVWFDKGAGKPDHDSCGYAVRKNPGRANRIEWEHVVPAHTFGQQRPCWRDGGRASCTANDLVFRQMEADMHNLVPAVGEVNGDRSNFRFGVLPQAVHQHGNCHIKIDFQQRVVEPRPEIRGDIARINFYMYDRYKLRMSRQQQQLFLAWDKQDPVSEWEAIRNKRISRVMGTVNPFVMGEKQWSVDGPSIPSNLDGIDRPGPIAEMEPKEELGSNSDIRGNRNSRVYHLPNRCPSYDSIKPSNVVPFRTEEQAKKAGFRRAGNCR